MTLTSSYTWSEGKQRSGVNDGLTLNNTPRHRFSSQLDWDVTDDINLWSKVAYNGEERAAGSNGVEGTRYPGYTIWDLGIVGDK